MTTRGKATGQLQAAVDFLEFTVPADRFYDVLNFLPGGMVPMGHGWRGYPEAALVASGKGRLGWSVERPEMGVHVSLGSQALGILAGLDDRWADIGGVLAFLRDGLGGHVTRLDVAWDDRDGLLDLDRMEEAVKSGHFTCRWKGGYRRSGWGNQAGETMYFGSRSSDAMLRAYNKRQERIAKGYAEQVEGVDHWVRLEMVFKRDRADAVAGLFQDVNDHPNRVFSQLAGILRGYLEFKVPNATDSNKRRWEPAGWWLTFLGHVEKARLVLEEVVRTIQNVMSWVSSQVAPSLALLEEALGSERAWSFLFQEAQDGRARWRPRHKAILAASAV